MAGLSHRIIKETPSVCCQNQFLALKQNLMKATPVIFMWSLLGRRTPLFEGRTLKIELFLSEEYPMASLKVCFMTQISHPNVDKLGRICLDILKYKWSSALQIRMVPLSFQALLSAPNLHDPLANDVAEQWKTNKAQTIETARAWTRLYAVNNT